LPNNICALENRCVDSYHFVLDLCVTSERTLTEDTTKLFKSNAT
jgi:hypothetical protein